MAQLEDRRSVARLYLDLQRADEELRRSLSRRVHDSAQQKLAAASITLSVLERQGANLPEGWRNTLSEARALISSCSEELRDISHTLFPPLLHLGLQAGLRALGKRLGDDRLDVRIEELPRYEPAFEVTVFRTVEDALGRLFAADGLVVVNAAARRDGLTITMSGRPGDDPNGLVDFAERLELRPGGAGAGVVTEAGDGTLRVDVGFKPTMSVDAQPPAR